MPLPAWKPRNTRRARALRNAATPAERTLWRFISHSQLGAKFSRQMPVGPFYADFLCRELGLVAELDGFSHDLRVDYDAARDRWFAREGYRLLRFRNEDVMGNVEGVVEVMREEIARLRAGLAHP